MSGPARHGEPSLATIFQGIVGVARGDGEAIRRFGHTERSFLISLVPISLFVLIGSQGAILSGHLGLAALELLASACALLTPPVLSHWFAHRWQRDAAWARFATAFNWCQFALMIFVLVAFSLGGILGGRGIAVGLAFALGVYALWLHWFLVGRGLYVSGGRAALVVLSVHVATTASVLVPRMIATALRA